MLDEKLGKGPFPVFVDEWRSPIFVGDIVTICVKVVHFKKTFAYPHTVFNLGGPDGCALLLRYSLPFVDFALSSRRISKADLATRLVCHRGYPLNHLIFAPRDSVERAMLTPPCLILNTARLQSVFGVEQTSFNEMLAHVFPS
jgi:hypothetical protein